MERLRISELTWITLLFAALLATPAPLHAQLPQPVSKFDDAGGSVASLAFSTDSQQLLIGGYGQVSIVDISAKEITRTIEKLRGDITAVDYSPDSKLILAGVYQAILLIDPETGDTVHTLKHHRGQVTGAAFVSETGIVSCSDDGTVARWELKDGQWAVAAKQEFDEPVMELALDQPAGQVLLALGDDTRVTRPGTVAVVELEALKLKQDYTIHKSAAIAVAVVPDSPLVLSGSYDEMIIATDVEQKKQTGIFKGHSRPVNCIAYLPKRGLVVSGSGGRFKEKNELILWELSSGGILMKVEPHAGKVTSVAVSPDNQWMASGGQDEAAILWDLSTLEKAPADQAE
ncbi:WD40 repeat domain-containing protein [Rubinisphaera margarita]|uniref:WD40 repeat domain-containing protein n=1 Tax=Rubinisphaera margarita TaxID=2909586 RepID=UPI001EE9157F|nr:WD40 repeat domain-containing protein [Rubinisphaera margarita]MCG6156831.1 WD40 repeat domain-containing protein [Rubinisphaera margarita]